MTIHELQATVDHWIRTHGVRYFHELTNVALLMEEVGEFARIMARTHGEQSFRADQDDTNIREQTADELADIIFVLVCLANQMDIDLRDAIDRNLQKKTGRDHDRHHGNPKLQE